MSLEVSKKSDCFLGIDSLQFKLSGTRWLGGLGFGALSVLCVACGGATPPAEQPDPAVESALPADAETEVPASSDEVKRASDLIKGQKFDEAAEILASETKRAPSDVQAAFFYGVALEGLGKTKQAAVEYRRAISLDPKVIESSQNLSAILLASEDNSEALKVTEVALEHAPKDPALLANRAIALDMLGRPEAVGAYEQLLEVKSDDQANRFNYAVALYLNKRTSEAKAQLLRISTSDMSLLIDIEKLFVEMKDFGGCITTWDKTLAQTKSTDGLAHRARCKLMAGDKAGAENDLKAALVSDSNSSIAHYYYGKMLQKDGNKAAAKSHFEAAVAADPGGSFGKAAKGEL